MAHAYTTKALVEGRLPTPLPDSITDDMFTDWIRDASEEVDEEVGDDYPVSSSSGAKFADTPDTPTVIARCAWWLAIANGYGKLREVNRNPNVTTNEEMYRKRAEAKLAKIRSGEISVWDSDGEDLDVDQTAKIKVQTRTQQFTATELGKF